MKRGLVNVVAVSAPPDDCLLGVAELARFDVNVLVPASGRWPDPALANLVAALEPMWCRVTGRTAGLVSKDKDGEAKTCPFAEWLGELIEVGFCRPPVGRVVDIVRATKTEKTGTRQRDKNSK